MSEQATITWHHAKDIKPPVGEIVLVSGGIAEWTGTRWLTQTGMDFDRPIQWEVKWWAYLPEIPTDESA